MRLDPASTPLSTADTRLVVAGGGGGGGGGGDGYGSGGGGGAGSSYWASDATGTSLAENTSGTAAEVVITPVPGTPPTPPSPSALPDFAAGQANTATISSSGEPTPALTESGSLPDNVTFTDNGDGTGTLAGDPPAADAGNTYNFSITAGNGNSPDQTQDYSLLVGQAPTFTSATGAAFKVGKAGSFGVTTTGAVPSATTLTQAGTLPGGVTFTDNGNGTGTLAGTPAPGSSLGGDGHGNYAITLTASNGEGSPTVQDFTLTVHPPAPPRHTGTVTVAGQPVVGQTLRKSGSLGWHSPDPLTIGIVWERCTTSATSGCTPLPATEGKTSHRIGKTSVGGYLTLQVTATDKDGQSTSYVAAPRGPVTG